MTERVPGGEPIFGTEPKAPDVIVHREMTDEEHKEFNRKSKDDKRADRDAYDAERERLNMYLNPEVPPEVDEGIGGPKPAEPIWATTTYLAAKTGGVAGKVPKWLGYKGSSFLTAIETWGKDTMKKNAPWLAKIPVVGSLLLGDVKKTWRELDKEVLKKREADEKAAKSALEKSGQAMKKAEKDAEAALKKQQTTENKKAENEEKNYQKRLEGFMTPLEEYNYKNGDEEAKKAILKTVEEDLPVREAKRKESEYEGMLIRHMTNEEETLYKEVIRDDDPDKDVKLATKAEFRERVIAELPARTAIAEAKQGNKKKGKGGGGGGGGKGKGRGRS